MIDADPNGFLLRATFPQDSGKVKSSLSFHKHQFMYTHNAYRSQSRFMWDILRDPSPTQQTAARPPSPCTGRPSRGSGGRIPRRRRPRRREAATRWSGTVWRRRGSPSGSSGAFSSFGPEGRCFREIAYTVGCNCQNRPLVKTLGNPSFSWHTCRNLLMAHFIRCSDRE